jgi:hypothetical protein
MSDHCEIQSVHEWQCSSTRPFLCLDYLCSNLFPAPTQAKMQSRMLQQSRSGPLAQAYKYIGSTELLSLERQWGR